MDPERKLEQYRQLEARFTTTAGLSHEDNSPRVKLHFRKLWSLLNLVLGIYILCSVLD